MKLAMPALRSYLVSPLRAQNPTRPTLINVDLATFAMIVYYAMHSKSQYGMPHIIKTVLRDTTVYFFVMAMCHSVLALFVIFAKVVTLPFLRAYA